MQMKKKYHNKKANLQSKGKEECNKCQDERQGEKWENVRFFSYFAINKYQIFLQKAETRKRLKE